MAEQATLLILADDLTGAADCAARCRHAGLPAQIQFTPPEPPLPPSALAFTSDSRHVSPTEAARRVAALVAPLRRVPQVRWYKKIDSTLRGNLGSELEAMLRSLAQDRPLPPAILCPAFPAQRRGLEDGYLVHEQTPPRTVHLPTLLEAQSQLPVAAIPLAVVRQGPEALAEALAAAYGRGAQLLVVDALADTDLACLVAAARQALPQALFCGSAGLMGVLAAELAREPGAPPTDQAISPAGHTDWRRALVVVGSGSEMAHRQLAALGRLPQVHTLEVTLDQTGPPFPEAFLEPPSTERTVWVLHLPRPAPGVPLEGERARRLVAYLARLGCGAVARLEPDLLVVVGGDTAIHLLQQLELDRLAVLAELLPGMPLTEGMDAAGRLRRVILKAGNHGDADTLCRLLGLNAR